MPRIRHIVFSMGGVVVSAINQAALSALDLDREIDAGSQLIIHDLERRLANGLISSQEYCRRVIRQTGAATTTTALETRILEQTDLLPGMFNLIEELSEGVDLGLVSDYPGQWAGPVIERTGLAVYFPDGPDQVTGDWGTNLTYDAFFGRLIELKVLRPGKSMWVDHNSLRCMAAIRGGIDAGIFVDARRFRRDLGLWALLPFDEDL